MLWHYAKGNLPGTTLTSVRRDVSVPEESRPDNVVDGRL